MSWQNIITKAEVQSDLKQIKYIKNIIYTLLICVICITTFASCNTVPADDGKTSVVTTNFPAYDFARAICQDSANVTMLLPVGGESHSYEPTPQDILKIQNADLFIYTGGESDVWVDKILNSLDNDVNTLKMTDCVSLLPVGGEITEEHEHTQEDEHDYEHDEHVWTSPVNAAEIVMQIKDKLCLIDSTNKDSYDKNAAAYIDEILKLDSDFRAFFKTVQNKILVFGDRFPLIYFTTEYGISYVSAFPGCADHSEPSAATIADLIEKIKKENISTIYYIEFSNQNIANTLADSANARTALFYTCHNISKEQFDSGVTYISLMRENLVTLQNTMK